MSIRRTAEAAILASFVASAPACKGKEEAKAPATTVETSGSYYNESALVIGNARDLMQCIENGGTYHDTQWTNVSYAPQPNADKALSERSFVIDNPGQLDVATIHRLGNGQRNLELSLNRVNPSGERREVTYLDEFGDGILDKAIINGGGVVMTEAEQFHYEETLNQVAIACRKALNEGGNIEKPQAASNPTIPTKAKETPIDTIDQEAILDIQIEELKKMLVSILSSKIEGGKNGSLEMSYTSKKWGQVVIKYRKEKNGEKNFLNINPVGISKSEKPAFLHEAISKAASN